MNIAFIVILVIFVILILVGIIGIGFYNKLVFRKKKVIDKFNAVYMSLKERVDIIDSISNIITTNKLHEDNILMELNKMKEAILENSSVNETLPLINESDDLLKKALSLDSIYDELLKDKIYMNLKDTFKNNQYKIMYSIEIYNEEVEEYNNYKSKGIANVISKIFRFSDYSYYKKENDI